MVGGEALPAELAAYWRRLAPGTEVVNEYGPTETVVGVRRAPGAAGSGGGAERSDRQADRGTRVYVLDEGSGRRRSACPGSCTWAGRGWRAVTWGGRS